jgi:SAM-dependent methyltransferase
MMLIGSEQRHHPSYSGIEKLYIALFGMPIVGLRIRARNAFSLIPKNKVYKCILDAGSGNGVFSFELWRHFPKARILGIDVLEEEVEACKYIARRIRCTNVGFRQCSIEDLAEKNTFDLILCIDILEHIEHDLQALKALYLAAAPGGVLILHVPALYRRYPIWKKSLNFDVETHLRIGYEPKEIREKLEEVGFKISEYGFTYGFWETLANNLSYMITRARMQNKFIYSIAFPILNLLSWLGPRARPTKLGAGIFVIGVK